MQYFKNNQWFSIVLALGLVLLLSFTWLYLLEYMIPFSRNIKWVENASKAFYESYAWIEDALYAVSQNEIWYSTWSTFLWFEYTLSWTGNLIPRPGTGNSQYSSNWNKISEEEPIQLLVWKNRLNFGGANRIRLSLRVPNGANLKLPPDDDIIFWQLSSEISSISSRSWSLLKESDINAGLSEEWLWSTSSLSEGVLVDNTNRSFQWFYNNNSSPCTNSNNECVLKISIINPLVSDTNNTIVPYLEYKIHTDTPIPLRFAQIESKGKSFGFAKTLKVAIPQQTTNSAFDFTIFQ